MVVRRASVPDPPARTSHRRPPGTPEAAEAGLIAHHFSYLARVVFRGRGGRGTGRSEASRHGGARRGLPRAQVRRGDLPRRWTDTTKGAVQNQIGTQSVGHATRPASSVEPSCFAGLTIPAGARTPATRSAHAVHKRLTTPTPSAGAAPPAWPAPQVSEGFREATPSTRSPLAHPCPCPTGRHPEPPTRLRAPSPFRRPLPRLSTGTEIFDAPLALFSPVLRGRALPGGRRVR